YSNTNASINNGNLIKTTPTSPVDNISPRNDTESILYYYVVVTPLNVVGCGSSLITSDRTSKIIVNKVPTINSTNFNTTTLGYCQNNTFIADSLKINYSPKTDVQNNLVTFKWYDTSNKSIRLNAINTDSFYTPPITNVGIKYYQAVLSNSICTTTSEIVKIEVLNQTDLSYSNNYILADTSYCKNISIVPNYSISKELNTGGTIQSVYWYKTAMLSGNVYNGILVSTNVVSNNSFNFTPLISEDSNYRYYVIATVVGKGCVNKTSTISGIIRVYEQPTILIQPNQSPASYCYLSNNITPIQVTVSANNNKLFSYNWYYKLNRIDNNDFTNVISITSSNLNSVNPLTSISSVNQTDSLFYYVQVQNGPSYLTSCNIKSNYSGGIYTLASVVAPNYITNASTDSIEYFVYKGGYDSLNRLRIVGNNRNDNFIKWYKVPTNGISLNKQSRIDSANNLNYFTNYYASQTINGCEGLVRRNVKTHIVLAPSKPQTPILVPGNKQVIVRINLAKSINFDTATSYAIFQKNNGVISKVDTLSVDIRGGEDIQKMNQNGYIDRTILVNTNNTGYSYFVKAFDSAGASEASDTSVIVYPLDTVIISPVICDTIAVVSFNKVSNINANYTISAVPVLGGVTVSQTDTTSPIKISGLLPNTMYKFIARVDNGAGTVINSIFNTNYLVTPINITATLRTATYCQNSTIESLNIPTVISLGNQPLKTYYWYANSINSNIGGNLISTSINGYIPSNVINQGDQSKKTYYYVLVGDSVQNSTVCSGILSRSILVGNITILNNPSFKQNISLTQTQYCNNSSRKNFIIIDSGLNLNRSWYYTKDSTFVNSKIINGSTSFYLQPFDSVGVIYYYAVLTQFESNCKITSNISGGVTVYAVPKISNQNVDTNYCVGNTLKTLQVTASAETGNLYYQWYKSNTSGNVAPTNLDTLITNEIYNTYNPASTIRYGQTNYYYVVVSLRNGLVCDSVYQQISKINVYQVPSITTNNIVSASFCSSTTAHNLNIIAGPTTGNANLKYQWYRSNDNVIDNFDTALANQNNANYTPLTDSVSTFYYYVVIKNEPNGISLPGCTINSGTPASITIHAKPIITQNPSINVQQFCSNNNTSPTLNIAYTLGVASSASVLWYQSVNSANGNDLGTFT
ncbi:MAG: hypothetical protein ORN58_06725, partial [Sediminibacterium sp.]|nr:hypothetical protein [Sediminibacterium sp.]